ncbi:chaperonin [Culex quinquefasciatus]|uniref:Chaperonin n=1 Tax=Culex quinquefasciatus TaxID=7176 RepID=B0XBC7_CULQU|nr:chaperonin [Culex quinquefasciatus]|eukprot:XP_001866949.1 chaperonin [Culex quinquefasciatus]
MSPKTCSVMFSFAPRFSKKNYFTVEIKAGSSSGGRWSHFSVQFSQDIIIVCMSTNLAQVQAVAKGPNRRNDCREGKGKIGRLSSFMEAIAIGDLVRSTPGPKRMDKILVAQGRIAGQDEVTNDEVTIFKAVGVENPAVKILVDMIRVQDDEVGDVLLLFHLNQINNPNLYKDTNNLLRIADPYIIHGYPLFK